MPDAEGGRSTRRQASLPGRCPPGRRRHSRRAAGRGAGATWPGAGPQLGRTVAHPQPLLPHRAKMGVMCSVPFFLLITFFTFQF